jgi:hypothetical protein
METSYILNMSFYNLQGRRFLGKDTSEELHGYLPYSAADEQDYVVGVACNV